MIRFFVKSHPKGCSVLGFINRHLCEAELAAELVTTRMTLVTLVIGLTCVSFGVIGQAWQ